MSAVIESTVDRHSASYQQNRAHMEGLLEQWRARVEQVKQAGGEAAIARHRKRGKLLPRERIELLCDPDTPFLEFNTLAAWGM
ncbi:MAG TPA: methylcrotonoyl-CoA carboxylase, partial [Ktedonobacterales bacterium]